MPGAAGGAETSLGNIGSILDLFSVVNMIPPYFLLRLRDYHAIPYNVRTVLRKIPALVRSYFILRRILKRWEEMLIFLRVIRQL